MQLCGLSANIQENYVHVVRYLANYYSKSLKQISDEDCTSLRASYGYYYRQILPLLLKVQLFFYIYRIDLNHRLADSGTFTLFTI